MILAVMNAIYAIYTIASIEAWTIQDFNGVWTRDLAIPVRRSNQLSYEVTDVGSQSFVGSNEPVRNECEWNTSYIELQMWNTSYITSHHCKEWWSFSLLFSLCKQKQRFEQFSFISITDNVPHGNAWLLSK